MMCLRCFNKENLVMLPDGQTMVTMSTVNSAYNSKYFIGNDININVDGDEDAAALYSPIEADGFTTPPASQEL